MSTFPRVLATRRDVSCSRSAFGMQKDAMSFFEIHLLCRFRVQTRSSRLASPPASSSPAKSDKLRGWHGAQKAISKKLIASFFAYRERTDYTTPLRLVPTRGYAQLLSNGSTDERTRLARML